MPVTQKVNGVEVTLADSERQPCEIWDRVMGYYRPVQDWNHGKKSEHKDRVRFVEARTVIPEDEDG